MKNSSQGQLKPEIIKDYYLSDKAWQGMQFILLAKSICSLDVLSGQHNEYYNGNQNWAMLAEILYENGVIKQSRQNELSIQKLEKIQNLLTSSFIPKMAKSVLQRQYEKSAVDLIQSWKIPVEALQYAGMQCRSVYMQGEENYYLRNKATSSAAPSALVPS